MNRVPYIDEPYMWCVMWQDRRTGFRGRGNANMDEALARRIAEAMNKSAPEIRHWIEQATTPAPAGQPPAEAGNP